MPTTGGSAVGAGPSCRASQVQGSTGVTSLCAGRGWGRRKDAAGPGENFRKQGTDFGVCKEMERCVADDRVYSQAGFELGLKTDQLTYVCFPGPVLHAEDTKMNRVLWLELCPKRRCESPNRWYP